jgi:glycosyltransferase involved in cell wall biosynthesis
VRIRFFGQRNILGGGVFFAEFLRAARALSTIGQWIEEIDPDQPAQLAAAVQSSRTDDLNIWFSAHHGLAAIAGKHVVWSVFENTRPPKEYLTYLAEHATVIWVPSAWGRDVLIANGLMANRIDVVPEGVCGNTFHPFVREPRNAVPTPFKFLALGKFEERKGYRQLLEGFRKAFAGDDRAQLFIKSDYFLDHERKKAEMEALVGAMGLANVRLLFGAFSPEDMLALYGFADAFVFPSRAEGWGLPLIEALACGVPAIATFHSGQTEYLSVVKDDVLQIEHRMEAITDPDFIRWWPSADGQCGDWASPEPASIASCMQQMIASYPDREARARRASDVVRARFDWSRSASIALRSLVDRGLVTSFLEIS